MAITTAEKQNISKQAKDQNRQSGNPQCDSTVSVRPKWQKIISQIPGYDPIATAEDCWFDEAAADFALGFFRDHLQFIEGEKAGEPFELEGWQQSIIANVFGWKNENGKRRYKTAFVFVPRKNGKTPLCAGIINYVAFCDNEPGAQIYSAAGDRDQAALVYRHCAGMVARNPELQKRCRPYRTYKSIEFYDGDAFYKAISAEADTKHGYNAHCIVVDELHVQPDRDLIDTLVTSTASRSQPLVIHITTAGFDKHSICYEIYDYACKVRDGIIKNSAFLPVIYEATEDDDWANPQTWRKCNPNLGISVSEDYLKEQCDIAKEIPARENSFRRLHLNQWTEQDERWLSMDSWQECAADPLDLSGMNCFAGLDMSANADLTAFVLFFYEKYYVLPFFFCPADSAYKRERRDKVPYCTWEKDGFIEFTDGDAVDYEYVRRRINEIGDKYNIRQIAGDPWNAKQILQQLDGDGFNVAEIRQGFASLSGPSKRIEQLVLNRELKHFDNPVMNWCVSNVTIETDSSENIKPSKKKSIERIDGVVALADAMGAWMASPEHRASIYESRGPIVY
jgi:phage terminase large subunit-like protein